MQWILIMRYKLYIFAALLALLVAACSSQKKGVNEPSYDWIEELRSNTTEVIESPDKTASTLELIDQMEIALLEIDRVARKYYSSLDELSADYDTDRSAFEGLMRAFNLDIQARRTHVLDIRFQMKELSTREEWAAIADLDDSLLKVWQRNPSIPKP
jgi:hypothetical protein